MFHILLKACRRTQICLLGQYLRQELLHALRSIQERPRPNNSFVNVRDFYRVLQLENLLIQPLRLKQINQLTALYQLNGDAVG